MATRANIPARHQNSSVNPGAKQVRIGGSAFTAFHVQGKVIGFCQTVSATSPQPVAPPQPIQPMDQRYPIEIAVPAAIGAGQIVLELYELYNEKVWDQFMRILDAGNANGVNTNRLPLYNDLVEVLIRMANLGNSITCTRIVYPPNKVQANKTQFYADTFHGCKIVDIRDDENVDIGTMAIVKNLTINYTFMRRNKLSA